MDLSLNRFSFILFNDGLLRPNSFFTSNSRLINQGRTKISLALSFRPVKIELFRHVESKFPWPTVVRISFRCNTHLALCRELIALLILKPHSTKICLVLNHLSGLILS
jgi:hypothetical protein